MERDQKSLYDRGEINVGTLWKILLTSKAKKNKGWIKVDISGLISDKLHLHICYQGYCPEWKFFVNNFLINNKRRVKSFVCYSG